MLLTRVCPAWAADNEVNAIRLDQAGYLPQAQKIAFVSLPGTVFAVRRSSDGSKLFEGKLSVAVLDRDSGDTIAAADFTSLRIPGTYYIEVPGVGRSYKFSIQPDVYRRAYYLAARAFYGQRCGMSVDMGVEFPGYSHPACHEHGEFSASSGRHGARDNVGGWHDAGDYGRYVVNSGISTGALLWTWEINGDKTGKVSLNIPESGKGAPDLLSEVRWNLVWMLKMQDDDGGVWHKQTSEHFAGFIPPQDDKLPSVVVGTGETPFKSTCATADLAAVAAIAGRVYKSYDAEFAAKNLRAARAAWGWVEQHPNVTFKNPPGITTGEYGDDQCGDETLWAAAELWRTTGEKTFNEYFLAHRAQYMKALDVAPAENWREVGAMGLWAYALGDRTGSDELVVQQIRNETVVAARRIVEQTRANPYHVSLMTKDYVWGSNGVAASYGMELIIANRFSPDPAFIETSLDNLHYLLGRNTFSLSWVTQLGANSFRHPHHRPSGTGSGSEAHPWPGMLAGGPNAGRQDPVMAKLPVGLPPAKNYIDEYGSYASNEIAINWQAMLVFLTAAQLP